MGNPHPLVTELGFSLLTLLPAPAKHLHPEFQDFIPSFQTRLRVGGQDPGVWGPCLGRPGPGVGLGRQGLRGPRPAPFSPAQQLVGGGVAKETPITMVTGFSWHPIGSLLSRSPSLPQVPLWLLFSGRKREYGERKPPSSERESCTPQAWGPPSRVGRRGRTDPSPLTAC